MNRARTAAYWAIPPLVCLAVFWYGFQAWFRADDFAWLGLASGVHSFSDLLYILFGPRAQGTIRPWSERAFFIIGVSLFGFDALPFRIVIFATHFANLALVASIGRRLFSPAAGFWAAVFWTINSGLGQPLGWICVYDQVMCGFFVLLAFYFLLRYIETGSARYNALQWTAFLLGFGALELMAIYPVLAAGYTFLCARKFFRQTWPLFIASVVYTIVHRIAAPFPKTGFYAMHFTGQMFRTLLKFWTWSLTSTYFRSPMGLPKWALIAGAVAITAALLAFACHRERRNRALFFLIWFAAAIAPMLPLRDHAMEYYIYIPAIGACWLGGWAFTAAWQAGTRAKILATALAALYAFFTVPVSLQTSSWNYYASMRARDLLEGVEAAHELHPDDTILLDKVDALLFLNAVGHHPFRLFDIDDVYITATSADAIKKEFHGDPGVGEFLLPRDAIAQGLANEKLVVYDVSGPRLRNITSSWRSQ